MPEDRRSNPVYKTLNKPLTIMGVERTAFAIAFFTAGAFQFFFGSLLGGIAIFGILLYFGRLLTYKDPMMIVFLVHAMVGAFKSYYDPCKYKPLTIRRIDHRA